MAKRQAKKNVVVDFIALLEKAKELNYNVQKAKDYSCYVEIIHKPRRTCEAANKAFHDLEKEYKTWKKVNIEKRGLVLKTAGDKDEPIAIVAVLAGSWSVPLECIANRWVVATTSRKKMCFGRTRLDS